MKCRFEVRAFRKRLLVAAAVVPRGTFKPILDTVRLVVDDGGQGTFVATDLETWVRVRAPLRRGTRPGAVQLPRQAFLTLLAGSQDAELDLEADPEAFGLAGGPDGPTQSLVVTGGKTRATLRSYRPEDFPDRAEPPETSYHEVEVRHLRRLIRTTSFATNPAETRYQLGGCWLGLGAGSVDVVATDGRRLARAWRNDIRVVGEPAPPQTHVANDRPRVVAPVLSARALNVLDGLLEELKCPNQAVRLAWTKDGFLQVQLPGLVFSTRQLEGRFPDWREAFPQPSPHRAHWGRTDRLLGVLKQAKAMADRNNPAARLGLRPGGLTLSVTSSAGGACDFQTHCEYRSEPVEAEFLPEDFIEVLTAVKDEAVDLVLGGPGVPAVLHATGLSVAIMPVIREETPTAGASEPPVEEPFDDESSDWDEEDEGEPGPLDYPETNVQADHEARGAGDSTPDPAQPAGVAPLPGGAGEAADTHSPDEPARGAPTISRPREEVVSPAETPGVSQDDEPETVAAGESRRPIQEFRLGRIRAVVWEKETHVGARYGVTINRLSGAKDATSWRRSASFTREDLPLVAKVADMAHTYIFGLAQNGTPF